MSRWMLVLLLGVALYVVVVVGRNMAPLVSKPGIHSRPVATITPAQSSTTSTHHPPRVPAKPVTETIVASVNVQQDIDPSGQRTALFSLEFDTDDPPQVTKEPSFEVRDATGKVVHQGAFEFG